MAFFQELRRRKVIRVAAAYLVAAWVAIQVAETVFPLFGFDDTPARFVVILLAIGFIPVLIIAWVYELTSEGIRRSAPAGEAGAPEPGGKLVDYALLAGVLILVASTVIMQFRSEQISPSTVNIPVNVADSSPSIAVLAFEDLSPDRDQEYFADGIAEELLNEFTRLEGLEVASRTSSFAFKDSTDTVQSIGRELGVNHVLEGSVRKDGENLRITVQLIRVADGFHGFSQVYDRELAGIFEIQRDVARGVAATLGVQFGLDGRSAYRGAGTTNIDAYDLYLRAQAMASFQWDRRKPLLQRAVDLDPEYGEAWAELGFDMTLIAARAIANGEASADVPGMRQEGLEYLRKALTYNPDAPEVQRRAAQALYGGFDWISAEQAFDRSIELDDYWVTLRDKARMYLRVGRGIDALEIQRALDNPPPQDADYLPDDWTPFFGNLFLGRLDDARTVTHLFEPDHPWRLRLEYWIAMHGTDKQAVREAIQALPETYPGYRDFYQPVLAAWDDRERVLETLRSLLDDENVVWRRKHDDIAVFAAYFGDPELALEAKSREARNTPFNLYSLWFPVMSEVRQLPEFKQLVTDIKLVEYWREYKFADACRPLGDEDFVCE